MKNTKRFVLGLTSSLLLAAGFARAADRLDPVVNHESPANALKAADGCTAACWAVDKSLEAADGCTAACWATGDGS
jgi:hypothetical protein